MTAHEAPQPSSTPLLPDGYVESQHGDRTCYYRADLAESLQQLGFLDGHPSSAAVGAVQGRVPHEVFLFGDGSSTDTPASSSQVVWKHCRRGGMVQPVLKDRHWSVRRFLREMVITHAARHAGVRVAPTLAVAVVPCGGGWKRVETLSELVTAAHDLEALLTDTTLGSVLRHAILTEVAYELRRFHGHGFFHGDLNVKNILWNGNGGNGNGGNGNGENGNGGNGNGDHAIEVTLIDLDPGSLAGAHASPRGNLLRLFRSYLKGEAAGKWSLTRLQLLRFACCYFRGDRVGLLQFLKHSQRMLALQSMRKLRWRLGKSAAKGNR